MICGIDAPGLRAWGWAIGLDGCFGMLFPCPRMPSFKCVLIEHGYRGTETERRIINEAGGEFIDAERLPLADALRLCEDAEAILCRRLEITADLIRRFRRCRILVRYGVGTDNIDVDAATEAGIIVGHVPVYCVDEVSTHAIALWLAVARKLRSTQAKMESGGWDVHRDDPIFRVAGKTLGIVGLGNIGRAVARKMSAWELRLLASDPYADPDQAAMMGVELVDLEKLCRDSDFISLHCPLLPETRHLIDAGKLSLMKPGAILVNTARGPVVETRALRRALDEGRLAGAGLDVFEEEPLPLKSPFRNHPRVVISDHTAWYSEESQADLQRKAAEEVARVGQGGLPFSMANPEVLSRLPGVPKWPVPEHVKWQLKRKDLGGVKI